MRITWEVTFARLVRARARFFSGELDAAGLRGVEDECIREVVTKQENVGLRGVTDGELRRTYSRRFPGEARGRGRHFR